MGVEFSVIINHFMSDEAQHHIAASALFSAALYVKAPLIKEVLLVDGSRLPSERMREECERLGVKYLHSGRMLSFAEGYNFGVMAANADWIILSASDIYPSHNITLAFQEIIEGCETTRLGCIIPRLSHCAFPSQVRSRIFNPLCVVPTMTLNVNVFNRQLLNDLGLVPTHYSGAYNDVELSILLAKADRQIYMTQQSCLHYGSLTIQTNKSSVNFAADRIKFKGARPNYYRAGALWDLDIVPLLTSRYLKAAFTMANMLGRGRLYRIVEKLLFYALPAFQRRKVATFVSTSSQSTLH